MNHRIVWPVVAILGLGGLLWLFSESSAQRAPEARDQDRRADPGSGEDGDEPQEEGVPQRGRGHRPTSTRHDDLRPGQGRPWQEQGVARHTVGRHADGFTRVVHGATGRRRMIT